MFIRSLNIYIIHELALLKETKTVMPTMEDNSLKRTMMLVVKNVQESTIHLSNNWFFFNSISTFMSLSTSVCKIGRHEAEDQRCHVLGAS